LFKSFFLKSVFSVIIMICFGSNLLIPVIAENAAEDDIYISEYNKVFKDSYVLYAGSPFYYKNGDKNFFDAREQSYIPEYIDENFSVPVTIIKNMLSARVDWQKEKEIITITLGDKKISMRLGEDSITVNSEVKYLKTPAVYNGTKICVSFIDVMKAFDYYIYSNKDGLVIASKNNILSDSFAETVKNFDELNSYKLFENGFENAVNGTDGKLTAAKWEFVDNENKIQNGSGITDKGAASGTYCAYMSAVPSSYMGVQNTADLLFNSNNYAYKLTYKVKQTLDYSGNNAAVIIMFYNGKTLVESKVYKADEIKADEWSENQIILNKEAYPDKNADNMKIIFATSYEENFDGVCGGGIFYDDINFMVYEPVSLYKQYIIDRFTDLFKQYILQCGFEENSNPERAWSYNDWGVAQRMRGKYEITDTQKVNGKYSACLWAVQSSFAGLQSPAIPIDNKTPVLKINFKIMVSDDYAYNIPRIALFLYKGSKFVQYLGGSGIDVKTPGTWIENSVYFSSTDYLDYDFDKVLVAAVTSSTAGGVNTAGGRVYFDDIKVENYTPPSNSVKSDIKASNFGSWFTMNDDVKFTFGENDLSSISKLNAVVYNSYNEKVYENTISAEKAQKEGWKWEPDEVGYYEVEFKGIRDDGSKEPVVLFYRAAYGSNTKYFELSRRSFAVVPAQTKPMSERNESIYLSDNCKNADELGLADLIGFYGIRMHFLSWGANAADPGINPSRGVYDWSGVDSKLKNIEKYGFGKIIANVLGTPAWAAPKDVPFGWTAVGLYRANCYAPTDMAYLQEFIEALTARYKDKISDWEFWNEQQMGKTAFWYDEPEKYGEMLKTAYKAFKKIQPESNVIIGGMHEVPSYFTFYDRILKDPEVYNSFDTLALHSNVTAPDELQKIAVSKGFKPKPWINTEAYNYCYFNYDNPIWLSYGMILSYLNAYKDDCKIMAQFEISDMTAPEHYTYLKSIGGSSHCMGLFRSYPAYEPKLGAVVAHTLFEQMGKEFTYQTEYELADGQKAALFNNDSEPELILWNSKDAEFSLDESIVNCLTEKQKIIDWEGKEIKKGQTTLKPNRMYFITGLDASKLKELEKSENGVLNRKYTEPYYTCKLPEEISESTQVAEMYNASAPIFNRDTFAESSDVEWINDGWKWVGASEKPEDFNVKHAAYIDKDGLYLMLNVTDSAFSHDNDDPNVLWKYDSMQFAMDCTGDLKQNSRIECQVGLTSKGPVLYKQEAPYIGANLPQGWSKSQTLLKSDYVKIEKKPSGMVYKIFIPMTELYPYVYPGTKDHVRISMLVNDNNGDGRLGYLEWSSGIGASKDPIKYGKLYLTPKKSEETKN